MMVKSPPTTVLGVLITVCVIPAFAHIISIPISRIPGKATVDYQDGFRFGKRKGQTKNSMIYYTNKSVSFVVAPYCSDSEFEGFAKTSIKSWLDQSESANVLLFENEKPLSSSMINTMGLLNFSNRVVLGPKLDVDEEHIPYVDDFFMKSFDTLDTDMMCFINQDVILDKGFHAQVSAIFAYFSSINRQFAVVGRRCSITLKDNETSLEKLHNDFIGRQSLRDVPVSLNDEFSHNFILISKNRMEINMDDIPSFYMGMQHWDMWLVGWLKEQIPVVVLGENCGSYHISHESNTFTEKATKMWSNFRLTQMLGDKFGVVSNLDWVLENGVLYNKDTAVVQLIEM